MLKNARGGLKTDYTFSQIDETPLRCITLNFSGLRSQCVLKSRVDTPLLMRF